MASTPWTVPKSRGLCRPKRKSVQYPFLTLTQGDKSALGFQLAAAPPTRYCCHIRHQPPKTPKMHFSLSLSLCPPAPLLFLTTALDCLWGDHSKGCTSPKELPCSRMSRTTHSTQSYFYLWPDCLLYTFFPLSLIRDFILMQNSKREPFVLAIGFYLPRNRSTKALHECSCMLRTEGGARWAEGCDCD